MGTTSRAELQDIHKVFGSAPVAALDGVSLTFLTGEVHTILGENGAGKSTLVHILSGLHRPTKGCVMVDGQELCFNSPSQALSAGIAMVHQRPILSAELTVLENIILGSTGWLLGRSWRRSEIEKLKRQWSIELDLSAPTAALPPSLRLYTALLAALYRKPGFLILDEPSAVLAPEERESFFRSILKARSAGLGIILITHNLQEAIRWSDRISVLRGGHLIYSTAVREPADGLEVTENRLQLLLNPHSADDRPSPGSAHAIADKNRSAGFSLSLVSARPSNRPALHEISFAAHPFGITVIFAYPGSGADTLEDILTGMQGADSGFIGIGDTVLEASSITPAVLRRLGVAFVPSDRTFRGSHPDLSILETLTVHRTDDFCLHRAADRAFAGKLLSAEGIDAPLERKMSTLSGGQIQRLILARELETGPRVLILAEPEWGLDIRSARALHQRLRAAASAGMTVIVLTDDLERVSEPDYYSAAYTLREGRLS